MRNVCGIKLRTWRRFLCVMLVMTMVTTSLHGEMFDAFAERNKGSSRQQISEEISLREAAKKTKLEARIDEEGGAYVRLKKDGVKLFERADLGKWVGKLKKGIAYAVSYQKTEGKPTAVEIFFNTKGGVVSGFVPGPALGRQFFGIC